ncbi:hypothetical protein VTN77DRAFT_1997 [Rasamsonia byssochlamydoides]|uniref:uncharacterized protein n=1 Tax=Rasamsonia byssochlamydoides TaxID=89139 RepID=UPI00374444A6
MVGECGQACVTQFIGSSIRGSYTVDCHSEQRWALRSRGFPSPSSQQKCLPSSSCPPVLSSLRMERKDRFVALMTRLNDLLDERQ